MTVSLASSSFGSIQTTNQHTDKINNIGKRNEFGDDLEGQDGNAMWKAVEGDDAARRIQEQGLLDKLILKQDLKS